MEIAWTKYYDGEYYTLVFYLDDGDGNYNDNFTIYVIDAFTQEEWVYKEYLKDLKIIVHIDV